MAGRKMRDELNDLNRDFLALGAKAEGLVNEAVNAIRHLYRGEVGMHVTGDNSLAAQGRVVSERCQRILLLYQPVALDFRQVTLTLRITDELVRAGNVSADIIKQIAEVGDLPFSTPDELSQMSDSLAEMIYLAMFACEDHSPDLLQRITWIRAEMSILTESLTMWLTRAMKTDSAAVEPGLGLFAVIQNCLRIADHTVAIVERVTSPADGPDLKLHDYNLHPALSG